MLEFGKRGGEVVSVRGSPESNPPPAADFSSVKALPVWVPGSAPRRNLFATFRRSFRREAGAPGGVLCLFADTRYVVRVNGCFLASGPARFARSGPEFDSWSLDALLIDGENHIEVLVNFFGASSFQTEPGGRPAFIAWGHAGGQSLETPGGWECLEESAWRGDSPVFSFAQGPVEICDTRLLGAGHWQPVEALSKPPWESLAPFSGTPWTSERVTPRQIDLAAILEASEQLVCTMSHDPEFPARSEAVERKRRVFGLWLFARAAAVVPVSCFWGDLECNGRRVPIANDTPQGNHSRADVPLQPGWNFLCGRFEVLSEQWAYCLGFPRSQEVLIRSEPREEAAAGLWISPLLKPAAAVFPDPGAPWPPPGWRYEDGMPPNLTPARVMAWDRLSGDALRNQPMARLSELSPRFGPAATWVFSFDGEILGHLEIDVEAPPGTIMDVATDDWQLPSGMLAIYRSNPFTDAADRLILRGGRQRVFLFHPRGGKYVQITLRAGESDGPFVLHGLEVVSRRALHPAGAFFESGHPVLDWVWPVAERTLFDSTDDSYSDSPWRERATYVGDALVAMHQHFLMHPDWRVARRLLGLFGRTALPDGQPTACAPSWLRFPHGDYSMLWILAVRDFWAHSGDKAFLAELWPGLRKLWHSQTWAPGAHGLLDEQNHRLFVDWGVQKGDRTGRGNAILNLLRVAAAQAISEIALGLGLSGEAEKASAEKARLESAIFGHLWSDAEGRLRPHLDSHAPALHANVLALHFQLGSPLQRSRILDYLIPHLRDNFRRGIQAGQWSGHLELYFFHFLLPALAEHGRPDLAEELVSSHYGFLKDLGDDTLPECFCRVERGVGSRCHSWSGGAATYAGRYVAGIRLSGPENPDRLLFHPMVSGIAKARARLAHRKGWIDIEWEKDSAGTIHLQRLEHPVGVTIHDIAGVELRNPRLPSL